MRLRATLRVVGVNVLVLWLLAMATEGVASWTLFALDAPRVSANEEAAHTRFDAELGWVSRPGAVAPDLYGPGVGLTVGPRGFRGPGEISDAVPEGRTRVVCSGDSFTLGFGVADDQAWCHLLGARQPTLEPVNMGQAGYGVDQAYLWYRRDGQSLQHQVQVFAFITEDFFRMRHAQRNGYAKPLLAVQDGLPVATNVPLTEAHPARAWVQRHVSALRGLRAYQLVGRARDALRAEPAPTAAVTTSTTTPAEPLEPVVAAVLSELARINRDKHSHLLLLHLPTRADHTSDGARVWRARVAREAARLGVGHLDLVAELRAMTPEEAALLFIPDGPGMVPGVPGHLSVRGNAWVADRILRHLESRGSHPRAEVY